MVTNKIDAPLGSGKARSAPRLEWLVPQALTDLTTFFAAHPEAYVAVSGGKDSTACLHLARRVNPDVKAAFFDSGLEFPQTLRYLARMQETWQLDLITYHAEPSALTVLRENGSWEHGAPRQARNYLHDACITRPLARAQADIGRASVYGLRADESKTRLFMLSKGKGTVTKHNRKGELEQTYLAPIWRWSHNEVHTYLGQNDVPLNPIYKKLMEFGVPERRARVGMVIDGWAVDQGRWAFAKMVAPDLCRVIETHLPALADYR